MVDPDTGVVTVAEGAVIDYEIASSHEVTVRATSADGSFADEVFSISVSNVR